MTDVIIIKNGRESKDCSVQGIMFNFEWIVTDILFTKNVFSPYTNEFTMIYYLQNVFIHNGRKLPSHTWVNKNIISIAFKT